MNSGGNIKSPSHIPQWWRPGQKSPWRPSRRSKSRSAKRFQQTKWAESKNPDNKVTDDVLSATKTPQNKMSQGELSQRQTPPPHKQENNGMERMDG